MKHLWLCADDYAQNSEISKGIRTLYALGHVNAVSCMTNTSFWPEEAQKLKALDGDGVVGLHLNLTHGRPLSEVWRARYGDAFHEVSWLLLKRIDVDVLRAECWAQWLAFQNEMGMPPDFVDGHRHVHQFPQVADVLLEILTTIHFQGLIRVSVHPQWWKIRGLKSIALAFLGGWRLRHLLCAKGFSCNTSFSGAYSFRNAPDYRQYFNLFLAQSLDEGLIMCHPGAHSMDKTDPLRNTRPYELSYFTSENFKADLASHGFTLKKKRIDSNAPVS